MADIDTNARYYFLALAIPTTYLAVRFEPMLWAFAIPFIGGSIWLNLREYPFWNKLGCQFLTVYKYVIFPLASVGIVLFIIWLLVAAIVEKILNS